MPRFCVNLEGRGYQPGGRGGGRNPPLGILTHLQLPDGRHREGQGQQGPPEATRTLKICFTKRKKRLPTVCTPCGSPKRQPGPQGALRPSSVYSATEQGRAAPDMRSRCPRGHMDGLEPGPGVERGTHMEQRDLRRGVPGTPSLHPSSFAPRNPENPHWRAAAEPETQVHGVPTTSCHGHCGRRSACS